MNDYHKVKFNQNGTFIGYSPAQLQPWTKVGWMKKEGGFFKTWNRRLFILAGNGLYYYENEYSIAPKGVLKLKANSVVSKDVKSILQQRETRNSVLALVDAFFANMNQDEITMNSFYVTGDSYTTQNLNFKDRTFIVTAESIEERDKWIGVIKTHIEMIAKRKAEKQDKQSDKIY